MHEQFAEATLPGTIDQDNYCSQQAHSDGGNDASLKGMRASPHGTPPAAPDLSHRLQSWTIAVRFTAADEQWHKLGTWSD